MRRLAACALFLASGLGGCNVFHGLLGTGPSAPEDRVLEGQRHLRAARYEKALAEFEAALAGDSSLSEAYVGAAKCELLRRRINVFSLVESFQKREGQSIPFLSEADTLKDKLYGANRGINRFLDRMVRREEARRSDLKIPVARIAGDYALSSAVEAVLSLADFNGDGRIDARDNILDGIIDLKNPANMTPDKLMSNLDSLKNDTVKIQALNQLLDKSQNLLQQSDKAVDIFIASLAGKPDSSVCPPDNPSCKGVSGQVTDSAVQQVKKFLQDAGSAVVTYKVQDREDNDGDGCADEELLDGIDNDGDGRVDEDSRGIPDTVDNPRFYAHRDGGDNNGDGAVDEEAEAAFHLRYQASFSPEALLRHPERRGQIFWKDSAGTWVDTRRQVVLVLDAKANPPLLDTVTTFDLCLGKVTGYKGAQAAPP